MTPVPGQIVSPEQTAASKPAPESTPIQAVASTAPPNAPAGIASQDSKVDAVNAFKPAENENTNVS